MELQATEVLAELNRRGGYSLSLLCTEQGLLIASDGDLGRSEVAAGLASLLNDIALRAMRDFSVDEVDEMTILSESGRFIVRALAAGFTPRVFLVVHAPYRATWRRITTAAARKLSIIIRPLLDTAP